MRLNGLTVCFSHIPFSSWVAIICEKDSYKGTCKKKWNQGLTLDIRIWRRSFLHLRYQGPENQNKEHTKRKTKTVLSPDNTLV